ncbi:hypothetical protein BHM03_00020503 [Ensete ventricosum]|nr:hypothetical protein BHM03_00020503 [Ensete ventricosum]
MGLEASGHSTRGTMANELLYLIAEVMSIFRVMAVIPVELTVLRLVPQLFGALQRVGRPQYLRRRGKQSKPRDERNDDLDHSRQCLDLLHKSVEGLHGDVQLSHSPTWGTISVSSRSLGGSIFVHEGQSGDWSPKVGREVLNGAPSYSSEVRRLACPLASPLRPAPRPQLGDGGATTWPLP